MDYGEEDDEAFGNIPVFGAILTLNTHTKKECLKRTIFALPSSQAEFVTRIKNGTVLFLFEHRKRQLFGIYQASSDGALDILPHAFNYSGQHFPAQVRYRQIWYCDPLSEKEFRDAIRENYFSANQFKRSLSKDQVRRLLYLLTSKTIPLNPRSEAVGEVAAKDRRWASSSRHGLSERGYRAADEYDEVLIDDRINAEGKGYHFPRDYFLAKKRRIGEEGRLTSNICVGRSTSGLQTSLPQEYTNSFVKPNFFADMDLNTSAPVNYNKGSLSSRLSPRCNMNRKELHQTSEANSIINRTSVFTRLSSKAPMRYGEERNVIDVNHDDKKRFSQRYRHHYQENISAEEFGNSSICRRLCFKKRARARRLPCA